MSTRLFVEECFDGKHEDCKGYNGPADSPNFRCDCDCHRQPAEDERVKRLLAEVRQDIAETSPNSSPMGVFRQHCEDLLQVVDGLSAVQPAASTPTADDKCIKCGHERRFSDNDRGSCEKEIPDNAPEVWCGCLCEFTTAASMEAQNNE